MHDHSSWQKLAQLEENNLKKSKAVVVPEKKRDLKAYNKLVKSAIKKSSKINCGKEQIVKEAFEKAIVGYRFGGATQQDIAM